MEELIETPIPEITPTPTPSHTPSPTPLPYINYNEL